MPFEQNYANENNATSIHAVNKESPVQMLHSTALPLYAANSFTRS